jgi:hypothetical protein
MPRGRPAIALLLVLAAACGGEDASALSPGDYFTQLARVSQNAHIQERGLKRDLGARLERAIPSTRLNVVEVYVGQSARLYQDVVDALSELQPDAALQGRHDAYVAAWQAQLDLVVKVRDAGYEDIDLYLEALEGVAFAEARDVTKARCQDMQSAVAAAGREVDLGCERRAA